MNDLIKTENTAIVLEKTLMSEEAVYKSLDLNMLGLKDEDFPRVQQRLHEIQGKDALGINELGKVAAMKTTNYTSEVLDLVKAKDTTTGQKLNEVVKTLGSLNTSNILNSKQGFFGKLFSGFKNVKQTVDARYASTKTQINSMIAEISESQSGLKARVQMMQKMSKYVEEQHKELGIFAAAGKIKIYEMQLELNSLTADGAGSDGLVSARVFELNTTITSLEKRVSDLQLLQASAEQTVPMIGIIANNNIMLINKFNAIKTVTVPAWEQQIALAITLEEQSSAVEMVNAIDDATNDLLKRNADLLHSNSVRTARANQRSVIDVETLEYVQGKLVDTIHDTIKINEEGLNARAEEGKRLEAVYNKMRHLVDTNINEASHRRLN